MNAVRHLRRDLGAAGAKQHIALQTVEHLGRLTMRNFILGGLRRLDAGDN